MLPTTLVSAVREHRAILFVGAGVSMNLGLPSFRQLVSHIGEELGFDADIFHTFGDYQSLAEYYVLDKRIGPLRSWMDRSWHPASIDIKTSEVHRLIVELNFPIIYTTNYDRWLERAHEAHGRAVHKVANVGDLVKAKASAATEIIKFHGDFDDDASIVLTESSYFQRMSFETPLDIRLRSDSLARPLIFIGYSITDPNIRYLLYKLQQLWSLSPSPEARPKSYVLMTRPNPVQEAVLSLRGVEAVVWTDADPGTALSGFLQRLLSEVAVA
jgi:SIR2-like domain